MITLFYCMLYLIIHILFTCNHDNIVLPVTYNHTVFHVTFHDIINKDTVLHVTYMYDHAVLSNLPIYTLCFTSHVTLPCLTYIL